MKIRLWSGDYTRDRQLPIFSRARGYIFWFLLRGLTGYVDALSLSLPTNISSQDIIRCLNMYYTYAVYSVHLYIHTCIDTCLFDVHVLLFRAELSTIQGA